MGKQTTRRGRESRAREKEIDRETKRNEESKKKEDKKIEEEKRNWRWSEVEIKNKSPDGARGSQKRFPRGPSYSDHPEWARRRARGNQVPLECDLPRVEARYRDEDREKERRIVKDEKWKRKKHKTNFYALIHRGTLGIT